MNKWFVTLVVGLMFGTALPAKADIEPIQKVMGKAETVQKKATAAQEKIMSYKKEIEDKVKKAKEAMAEAQGLASDVKGAINDAQAMSDAVKKGDFSSFNVMPADLKKTMTEVKQAKSDVSSQVKDAKDMATEAQEVSSGATALASQSISDAKSQAGISSNKASETVATTSNLSSSVKNTAELSSVQKDVSVNKAILSAVNSGTTNLQTVNVVGQKNAVADVKKVTLDKTGGTTLSSSSVAGSETKQEILGRRAFTVATEEETEEKNLEEAEKLPTIISADSKEELIIPDKNLLIASQRAPLEQEVSGAQKVELPKEETEKVILPTTDNKSLVIPATKTISEPVKAETQQILTNKKELLNSKTLTAPQVPVKTLQKNSFWLDETSPMILKIAQTETLTFADEATSNQNPEDLSKAVGETFLPKEGEGDSVEEAKKAKENMQEFMRSEVTALYATGFTIRTNMAKEADNRDVDMENENQMWKETILKAEDCITRTAKIHILESMLSSYQYSEALQDLVIQQTESLESEEE